MTQDEALKTARELLTGARPFIMATVDADGRPRMRWMGGATQDPEDENVYYLACGSQSRKVGQISRNPATQFLCQSPDFRCSGALDGSAELVTCQDTKNMVWEKNPGARRHFSGPEAAEFGVIKFTLERVEVLCMSESREPVRVEVCS